MMNEFRLVHKTFINQRYVKALFLVFILIMLDMVRTSFISFSSYIESNGGVEKILELFNESGIVAVQEMYGFFLNMYISWDHLIISQVIDKSIMFVVFSVILASIIAGIDYDFKTMRYKTVFSHLNHTYFSHLLYTILVSTVLFVIYISLIYVFTATYFQITVVKTFGLENLALLIDRLEFLGIEGYPASINHYIVLLYGYMMFLVFSAFSLTKIFKNMYVAIIGVVSYYYVFALQFNLDSVFNFSSWIHSIELYITNGESVSSYLMRSSVELSISQSILLLVSTAGIMLLFSYLINVKLDGGYHGS